MGFDWLSLSLSILSSVLDTGNKKMFMNPLALKAYY
jgi:hypothetical protein